MGNIQILCFVFWEALLWQRIRSHVNVRIVDSRYTVWWVVQYRLLLSMGQNKHNKKVQAYATTSHYDDNEIEKFCDQLQNVLDQTPKKDILVAHGDWNAKVVRDACGNWQGICWPFCNDGTNKRGIRLLEFATFNDLMLASTSGHHKASMDMA